MILGFIVNIKIRLLLLLCLNNIIELHHSLLIPRSRFAIAPQHPKTAIAHNHLILNNRTPHPQTAIAHNPNFRQSHPISPKQRSHPTSQKRSHSQIPKTIAPNIPKQRFLRSASLSHPNTPKNDRTPTHQKRTDKSALALLHS